MRVLELIANIGNAASSCSIHCWQLTLLGHFLCSFHLQLPALVIGHRRTQLLIIPNTTNSRFLSGTGVGSCSVSCSSVLFTYNCLHLFSGTGVGSCSSSCSSVLTLLNLSLVPSYSYFITIPIADHWLDLRMAFVFTVQFLSVIFVWSEGRHWI